jgi:glycosyltransferase involved in cell wall biosynthesis
VGIRIVIPAYNAARTIVPVLAETAEQGYPIIVVDDGSTDGTADLAAGPGISVVRHEINLGKGAALRTGFSLALAMECSAVVTIDADGQHDPQAVYRMVSKAEESGADILIASRAKQFSEMAGLRESWNRFGVWCMRRKTGFEITDSQSGFRYYSERLLRNVSLSSDGYELEMEVLMKAWRGGYSIASLPVAARVADGRSTSHFRPVRDTWNICMTFLKYFLKKDLSDGKY